MRQTTSELPGGIIVPLVTPFTTAGAPDERSFAELAEWLIGEGIAGLVLAGTTGESPTLRWLEVERLLEVLRAVVRGRVPILVGTGTNDTAESVERTRRARQLGADFAFAVTPYYSRPAPAGVLEHYRCLGAVMPTVAYHIPYRTALTLDLTTLRSLLALPGIVAMKESSGSIANFTALAGEARLYCGDDALFLAALEAGAAGGILASANVIARELVAVHRAVREGQPLAARSTFARVRPVIEALFAEPSPAPLKWMLARRGRIASPTLRLPQVPISESLEARLGQLLEPPAPGSFPITDDELGRLAARFTARELPVSEWTHTAHLMTGAWHVFHLGPDRALPAMRDGIRRLNQAHGTPETPARGYHETITRAYVELLASFLGRFPEATPLASRVAALLAHPLAARDALLGFYARDRLMSPQARAAWLEPDHPLI
jgi:4-hydroxy-tetrahydrodipicolinate synthase